MPNRQPTEHWHTQFSKVVVKHVNRRPLAAARFTRADKLTHRLSLQALEAPRSSKLRQYSLNSTDARIQATGTDSAIQGNCETGRVPGVAVLAVLLGAGGGSGRAANSFIPMLLENS
jgi:hypothetical protein